MPIASSDILYKWSTTAGAAGNSTAAGAAGTSLGKYIATTQIVDATLNNLFPDITGDENAASNVDYQCIFVHNNHATLTLQNAVAWLSAEVAGGATVALATDNIAASAVGSASAQAAQIANKNTAPTGVSAFSAPTTKATGLSLGSIGPGQVKAIWVRRTATNSAAQNNDGATLRVEGDTAA
jgi:hypothetical protein